MSIGAESMKLRCPSRTNGHCAVARGPRRSAPGPGWNSGFACGSLRRPGM